MKKQRKRKARRGAVMIEMAIVLPIFSALLLGIIELSQALLINQLVTNAARDGARLGIFDGSTNADVEKSARDFLQSTVNTNLTDNDVSVTITVTPAPGNEDPADVVADAQRRDLIVVRVEVPFDKVSWFSPIYMGGTMLVGQSSMRHE